MDKYRMGTAFSKDKPPLDEGDLLTNHKYKY